MTKEERDVLKELYKIAFAENVKVLTRVQTRRARSGEDCSVSYHAYAYDAMELALEGLQVWRDRDRLDSEAYRAKRNRFG